MTTTTATLLAKKVLVAHSTERFDCRILDEATTGLTLRNEFGRIELRRFNKLPSVKRLANLLAITFA